MNWFKKKFSVKILLTFVAEENSVADRMLKREKSCNICNGEFNGKINVHGMGYGRFDLSNVPYILYICESCTGDAELTEKAKVLYSLKKL